MTSLEASGLLRVTDIRQMEAEKMLRLLAASQKLVV
jgi:hypothetical protein